MLKALVNMRNGSAWLLICGMCAAGGALGQADSTGPGANLTDPHINSLPRTTAELDRIAQVMATPVDFNQTEQFEGLPGGAATVAARGTTDAFSQPSANIAAGAEIDFIAGVGLFEKLWVQAPSSTLGSDGLGPLYNARSCESCHRNGGRGLPPSGPDDPAPALVLRLSVLDNSARDAQIAGWIATLPDPVYGQQLQSLATSGLVGEFRFSVTYTRVAMTLAGNETMILQQPEYTLTDFGYGPLSPDIMTSARIAPQLIGLGLLDAVPAMDILALADPDDMDRDGISGRPSLIWSDEFDQLMLGRFGHKATVPTLHEQVAAAFATDIGISSPLHPDPAGDCTPAQTECQLAQMGDSDVRETEIDAKGLALVTLYARNLAVPARRLADDPDVLAGKQLFYEIGCVACHQPRFVTARMPDQPEQSFQLIWPYTDMLLHDMGPGLADDRPDGVATGTEWRTAPLWGIGLTAQVSGGASFLHDGRAGSVLEAILWHGGEALAQRDMVAGLAPADRAAIITFLESL